MLLDFHLTPLRAKLFESFLEARRMSGKTVCTDVSREENIRDSYADFMISYDFLVSSENLILPETIPFCCLKDFFQ